MKTFSYILSCFFAFLAIAQTAYSSDKMDWDSLSDQQITSCLSSDTFQNISLLYSYEHQNWKLRIIFNPQRERIEISSGRPSMFQFYYGVFSEDRIPESLERHLKDMVESRLGNSSGGFWGISSLLNGQRTIDYFADAIAVQGTARPQTPPPLEVPKETKQAAPQHEAAKEVKQVNNQDREISDLLKGQTFKKLSLSYEWEGKSYPIHFVYNPMREALFCAELSEPLRWPFAMTIEASSYPLALAKHIKDLVPMELLKDPDSMIDVADWISYTRKHPVSIYKNVNPILLLNKIENPEIDAEIQAIFTSSQLAKKPLYYQLEGVFYKVFLIHNPEKVGLQSTLSFDTWESGRLSYTATWNSKIGIFVDKVAPQALVDHLSSQLGELSWWDSYWNLSIHNGDRISIKHFKGSWEYTYTPYSWYTFMFHAQP